MGKCWGGVGKCVGVWGVEKCRKRCGRKCVGVPHASLTLPHIFHLPYTPNTLSNISPNTSCTPLSPFTFPTPQHTFPTSPNTSPHPPHPSTLPYTSPHISLYLPYIPTPLSTPPPTLPHISLHVSLHLSHTLTNFPIPSILTPYTIPHFKKIMLKCFYIRFKPEKYIGTIVPMPPVKSGKKKKQNPICQQCIGAGSGVPGGAQAPPELFLAPPEPFEPPLTIKKIMH